MFVETVNKEPSAEGKPDQIKQVLTILACTGFAILATILIGYVVTEPPRGFMYWVAVGFLCLVEFLVGALAINQFSRASCQYKPSGAILVISYAIIGSFAVTGIVAITIYWLIRDENGSHDAIFTAVLMILTVCWFGIAALLYANDLRSQVQMKPVLEKREEHRSFAISLSPILSQIRSLDLKNDSQRSQLDRLQKKVETLSTALKHSHGGGLGSIEAGRSHPLDPRQEEIIRIGIVEMSEAFDLIQTENAGDEGVDLTAFELKLKRVSAAVEAQQLL